MQMMAFKRLSLLVVLGLVSITLAFAGEIPATVIEVPPFNRTSFGKGFLFGSASSAYQYEGAANMYGRGESIWDVFSHLPNRTTNGDTGDVAIDQYHRYKEDVGIMKYMNLDAYRFSISWPRILPTGRRSGGINDEGVKYYKDLIKELKDNGIQPFVTLFHWDLPQALEEEYNGFLNKTIVDDFRDYADLCFDLFGHDVKHWITINEPSIFSSMGYALGWFAPGRCTPTPFMPDCLGGDSSTEPYRVAHNMLLAHAAAVKVYRDKYFAADKGKIGITLSQGWVIPYTNTTLDQQAANRSIDFGFGWFMEPLTNGDYPRTMRILVGGRLPEFSPEESQLFKDYPFDFLGLNYYTSNYANHSDTPGGTYFTDSRVNLSPERNGVPLGPRAGSGNGWIYIYPKGLRDMLLYIKDKYANPVVFITENGMDEFNDPSLTVDEAVRDTYRIDYYYRHLYYVHTAKRDGSNVQGYFAWSLLDNFEWASGYTSRFGINFVDYNDGLKRYHKLSATWFRNFLQRD